GDESPNAMKIRGLMNQFWKYKEFSSENNRIVAVKRISNVTRTVGVSHPLTGALSACATTSQGQVALQQETPTGDSAPTGAVQFLGSDASLLQPGGEGRAAYVYIKPNVQWSNYKSVLLKPVEFWDSPDTTVSAEDQKMLTSYFYNSLKQNLQKNFTLV